MPGELKAETWWAGLCPPRAGSLQTSAVELRGVGLSVGGRPELWWQGNYKIGHKKKTTHDDTTFNFINKNPL